MFELLNGNNNEKFPSLTISTDEEDLHCLNLISIDDRFLFV
jgi:hypothetical protein